MIRRSHTTPGATEVWLLVVRASADTTQTLAALGAEPLERGAPLRLGEGELGVLVRGGDDLPERARRHPDVLDVFPGAPPSSD